MSSPLECRRDFICKAAGSSLAAAILGQFYDAKSAFANLLDSAEEINQEDQFERLAEKYTLHETVKYLNHASIGTIANPVQKMRQTYLSICEQNPWLYMWGGEWDEQRESVRQQCAELLHCESEQIAINHNTTEIFNLLHNLGISLKLSL